MNFVNPSRYLRDLSISRKLSLSFLLMVVLAMLVGGVAIYRLAAINATTIEMRNNWLMGIQLLGEAQGLATDELRLVNAHILTVQDKEMTALDAQIAANQKQFDGLLKDYLPTVTDVTEKSLVAAFQQKYQAYVSQVDAVLRLSREQRSVEARALLVSKADPAHEAVRLALRALVDYNQRGAVRTAALAADLFESGWQLMLAFMLVIGMVAAVQVRLMHSLLLQPILRQTRTLNTLAGGTADVSITDLDRADEIGHMAQSLLAFQASVVAQNQAAWIKGHSADIAAALQGIEAIPVLARQLMCRLTPLVGAQVGVFYIFDSKEERFSLVGSHGYKLRKNFNQHFRLGEGIVGQCAAERAPILLSDLPPDYMHVASGLGASLPRFVLAAPVMRPDGKVVGVAEVGLLRHPEPRERALFDEVLPMIGVSISILENNHTAQHEEAH